MSTEEIIYAVVVFILIGIALILSAENDDQDGE